jgi:hypothetical protein
MTLFRQAKRWLPPGFRVWVKTVARGCTRRAPLWLRFRRTRYGFEVRRWYRRIIQ